MLKNDMSVAIIFVDPLVQPLAMDSTIGMEFINVIEKVVETYWGI